MLLLIQLAACFVAGLSNNHTRQIDLLVVETAQGWLRGSIMHTYTRNTIYAFRGIPFAQPPVDVNKFQPPKPVKQWKGVYNATEDRPVCPQPYVYTPGLVSEDCLYLNVYTKTMTTRQPVLVFFHPGGFVVWTGRSSSFGPQYFMTQDIVLITSNYRLGVLGFLSTGDRKLRGNYGMKDQVAVLRWVKENIDKFGGDPDNVTIMGYSAGSVSVQLHLLSPMSKGLFHKAIAMSGSVTAGWAINRNPIYLAKELTKHIGCEGTLTPQQVYDCVKSADGQLMADRSLNIRLWSGPISVLFAPVIEKDYGVNQERFLTDEPIELLKRGEINSVPLIIGMTSDELAHISYSENWK